VIDVAQRLTQLHQHKPELRLYALVDGAQYETHREERLTPRNGLSALFEGTPDAALAHAGPWLADTAALSEKEVNDLATLEREAPAVSWLIASLDLMGLTQLLQLQIDMKLPDSRTALLRFWDPRVLVSMAQLLEPKQRESFFAHIEEWHLLHQGKRAHIGRQDAHAQ
jgi:Domain of unknown function (DUF4123)